MKASDFAPVTGSASLLAVLGAVCLLGMLTVVCLDVIGRTTIGFPLPETIELVSNIFMVGLVFLPLPLVQRDNAHISVETFMVLFPNALARKIETSGLVLTAGFYGLIAYAGVERALRSTRIGESALGTTFNVPVWPSRWLVVVCFAVAAAVALGQVLNARGARD